MSFARSLSFWFVYAARNLRSGLNGFWILLACLFLGVAAIAVIGSLSASIERGLTEQGQPLLGGDVEFSLVHREALPDELAYMQGKGEVSRVASMRAMAAANGKSTLVELKAIDAAYPLYGTLDLEGGGKTDDVLAQKDGLYGVAVDPLLPGRLGVGVGDKIRIGTMELRIGAVIAHEPDKISDGLAFGPRLMMSHAALEATGLVQPGSLVTWRYRVKLADGATLDKAKAIVDEANTRFPKAGWRVRTTDNAAQGAERFVERLGQFMTLVAIAALVVGGAGIANAVSSFVNRRQPAIATLKCLGLASRDVTGLYLAEILLVGSIGIAFALAVGAAAPWLLNAVAGDVLPLPLAAGINWLPLGFAALLGFLVLVAFTLLPLARISTIRGVSLFRGMGFDGRQPFAWRWLGLSALFLAIAAAIVIFTSGSRWVSFQYVLGLAISLGALSLVAYGILKLAAFLPQPRNILLRQAIAALHRPGAPGFSVILALGLGLTLFVMLSLTDRSISTELRSGIPQQAPAFFFLDVRNDELDTFRAALREDKAVTDIGNAPMLRGRIVKVKGIDAEKVTPKPDAAWALKGDRGLTYSDEVPAGSTLVGGTWWPKDYAGPPLVSMSDDIADGLDLKIGDKITVNVLGREIEAEVSSLRKVDWRSLGINFVMVFSPSTLKSAPNSHIVTVDMKGGDEAALLNRMAERFPSVTAVRVKDAVATVDDLLGKMLAAVRGANAVTLLTGVLVLAGALAAGLAARAQEAVILKTYGATRRQLLLSFMIEYGIMGLIAAVFGVLAGSLASWYLAAFVLGMPWVFSGVSAILTAVLAMVLAVGAGLLVTARALSIRPSVVLRNE